MKKIFKLLLLILAVLIAGELLARVYDSYESVKKYNRLLNETVVWRDQIYSISKPAGTKRVLILGGSAVYDTVDNYKESWPYYLEQKLESELNQKVEVINMGFFTENSSDELFKLRDAGMQLDPDLVIVFDGFNDVYNQWVHHDYWKRHYEIKAEYILKEKKRSALKQFWRDLKTNSALYQRIRQLRKAFQRKLSLYVFGKKKEAAEKAAEQEAAEDKEEANKPSFDGVSKGPGEDQFFESRERWDEIENDWHMIYSTNLDKMGILIHRIGARGLFIFQPDLSYKPLLTDAISEGEKKEYLRVINKHEDVWREIIGKIYPQGFEIMRDTAGQHGFPFYNFNDTVLMEGDTAPYFDGNVHFREAGRRRISDEIYSIIMKDGLLS